MAKKTLQQIVSARMQAIVEEIAIIDRVAPPGNRMRAHRLSDMAVRQTRYMLGELASHHAAYAAEIGREAQQARLPGVGTETQ